MTHQSTSRPAKVAAANCHGLAVILSGSFIFFASMAGRGAELVAPLVTPAITPAQEKPKDPATPGPALGFTPPPTDASAPSAPPPLPDDGFNPLPGDPNAVLPTPDELPAPITTEELAELKNPSPAEMALPAPDSNSNNGDFADTLGEIPRAASGSASGAGTGGGWPSGFADTSANMPAGGLLDNLRQGLAFSALLSGTYDSNPSQGYGTAQDAGQGDFFTTLGGIAAYRSKASTWTYGATYAGSYSQYFNQSDLSGYNQNAGASLNYQGGSLSAALNIGINFGSGANRYYASVVDQISYNYNLSARYRVSRKTSITGDFSQRFNRVSGGGGTDTDSFDLGASALWHYSPLTEFGPGIRYTSDGSGNSGLGRTSIGPTMTVNYQLAKKVSLNSRIGMDFAEYENGVSPDPSWSTSIGLDYRASKIWGMNLSLLRDTQTSYSSANEFEEITSLRLGYNRRIRRAIWTLGMGLESRTSQSSNPAIAASPDHNYLTFDTALGMPVFADTCNANIFTRYSDQSGDANATWDSFQFGFSISRSF